MEGLKEGGRVRKVWRSLSDAVQGGVTDRPALDLTGSAWRL